MLAETGNMKSLKIQAEILVLFLLILCEVTAIESTGAGNPFLHLSSDTEFLIAL